jgi:F5/8 type C domain
VYDLDFDLDRRIRTEKLGGAWCPKQAISRDAYEWLEIDLQELKAITQVETQGRFGNGQVRDALASISAVRSLCS